MKDEFAYEEWQEEMTRQTETLQDLLKKPLGGMNPKDYFEWKYDCLNEDED